MQRWLQHLTEAEEIKKRWQEYIESIQKISSGPDNHNGVVTHLEPDVLDFLNQMGLKKHHYEQS